MEGTVGRDSIPEPKRDRPMRRHGRRPIRSALTGPHLPNPSGRTGTFELSARGAISVLQRHLGSDLDGVRIGFSTAPVSDSESEHPLWYSLDRDTRTIMLFRMPIQRARGLHIDDEDHRRLFIEHCVYLAVCEYLGRPTWEVMPGRFDHF